MIVIYFSDEFERIQTIYFDYNIAVGLRLYIIPTTNELIFGCCLNNSKISIYFQESTEGKFQSSVTLSGHEDWVRSLDFTNDGKCKNINY